MISSCPHCNSTLKLGDAQKAKLQEAIDALAPGKKLTIKCPSCQQAIMLDKTSAGASTSSVKPPEPPDLSWMKESNLEDDNRMEDVPMALVLFPDGKQRDLVQNALETVGYQVAFASSVEEAHERMRFTNYACVVQHSTFEGPKLADSTFYHYMCDMSMRRRRYLFYILIGPEFHTLYNLQALAFSANLVVNDKDLMNLGAALRHSIPAYEVLFGPFMEELTSAGKS